MTTEHFNDAVSPPSPPSLMERLHQGDGIGENLSMRTLEDYAKRVTIMGNHITAGGGALSPTTLAGFLETSFETGRYARSTGRLLKASALHWLTSGASALFAGDGDISEYGRAFDRIIRLDAKLLPKRTTNTSGTKLKFFSKQALTDLTDYTREATRSQNAGIALAFVRANLLVGLRPIEWFQAALCSYLYADGRSMGDHQAVLALHVHNAKNTHGRANGEARDILLINATVDEAATIRHYLEIVRRYAERFPVETPIEDISHEFYASLQHVMTKAWRKRGYDRGSRPTLYSTRHQAVANCKRSGMTDLEVAAFFGHVSTSTAKKHYGKKSNGWAENAFRPSPESVAAVKVIRTKIQPTPSEALRRDTSAWLRPY